jgi:hypothetical protein
MDETIPQQMVEQYSKQATSESGRALVWNAAEQTLMETEGWIVRYNPETGQPEVSSNAQFALNIRQVKYDERDTPRS